MELHALISVLFGHFFVIVFFFRIYYNFDIVEVIMIIPKFIIDQSIINAEIRVINSLLSQQRQLKQTLIFFLYQYILFLLVNTYLIFLY